MKKTVNFDDPGTYHFYFGDESGNPGTIITFFPWQRAYKGRIGGGQVGTTTYVIPLGAMKFWKQRLDKFSISFEKQVRFGEEYVQFEDPHGLKLELVERNEGKRNDWNIDDITPDVAIKGFGGAVLLSTQPEKTAELLHHVLGLDLVGEDNQFIRFRARDEIGNTIDLNKLPVPRGQMGVGTVHHIAWRADDNKDQLDWNQLVTENGYHVTDVKDRNYFHSIYFREYGELLFEIATDLPGFAIDERIEQLGEALKLPSQFEPMREKIESVLSPITVRVEGKKYV